MKPIIGIIEWPYEDKDTDRIYEVPSNLAAWVLRAGGIPVGIFPGQTIKFYDTLGKDIPEMNEDEKQNIIDTLKLCQGIIKPGATRIYNYERFIYEYAEENDIPFLGICAGMQMMATNKEGGQIIAKNPYENHLSREKYVHYVNILKNTKLYDIVKLSYVATSSVHRYHIQDSLYHDINAVSTDNIIEGIENPDMEFGIGVQWHPENAVENDLCSQNLFGELIEHAKTRVRKK